MDLETVSAEAFGAGLRGLGLNLLVSDVAAMSAFLREVMGLVIARESRDFAIVRYGAQLLQLHHDATFARHPLHALLPEAAPRGAGMELRLFDTDPDVACHRAQGRADCVILAMPADKPHGLREAVILGPDGYAWVPSRPL